MVSPSPKASQSPVRRLLPYLWPVEKGIRLRIVLCIIFLLLAKISLLIVPLLYKMILDQLQLESTSQTLAVFSGGLILVYGTVRILTSGFSELRDALFGPVEQQAIRHIALQVFQHLHHLSLRFHLDRKTGGLSRSIERGTKSIETFFRFLVFTILPTFLEIFLVCGVLWALYPGVFALTTFVTLAIYIFFTLSISNWRTAFIRKMNQIDSDAGAKSLDSLLNYTTVKYFGNEAHEAERFDDFLRSYEKISLQNRNSLSLLNFGQAAIIAIGLTVVMLLAANEVGGKQMTLGDFVLINTYLLQVYIPLNVLGFAYREIKQALLNMDDMFQLMDLPQEVKNAPDAAPLSPGKGDISFENVSFGYSSDRLILKDISFTAEAGKTLAIVGPSGAGKTTILNLLFRFFDPGSGAVLINDQDIKYKTQESLRGSIAVVPQDTILFNDTIFYNIAYGNLAAPIEHVEAAAKKAHIHDFIESLPQKYGTLVGERGLKLSGGEKQRVSIARALLKNPKIFIFDEATSSLDTQTEKAIQKDLKEISKGYTTIVIAHRLSTIVDADRIMVLHQGKVVEQGSHAFLLSQEGFYAALWMKQQKKDDAHLQ